MNTKQKPKQKSPPHVWVVEMGCRGEFKPCDQCSRMRYDAENDLDVWRVNNPDDTFRIAKYVRADQ